jgi:hypothetical protein
MVDINKYGAIKYFFLSVVVKYWIVGYMRVHLLALKIITSIVSRFVVYIFKKRFDATFSIFYRFFDI